MVVQLAGSLQDADFGQNLRVFHLMGPADLLRAKSTAGRFAHRSTSLQSGKPNTTDYLVSVKLPEGIRDRFKGLVQQRMAVAERVDVAFQTRATNKEWFDDTQACLV